MAADNYQNLNGGMLDHFDPDAGLSGIIIASPSVFYSPRRLCNSVLYFNLCIVLDTS